MKIAIDYTSAVRKRTGIGNNIFYLVENLQKIDKHNHYYLYFSELSYLYSKLRNKSSLPKVNKNFQYLPLISYKLYSYFIKNKIDIVHATNFKISFTGRYGTIATIHDIAFLLYPDFVPENLRPKYIKRTKKSAEKSNIVITVSHSSAYDINKVLGVPKDKIRVVYNGVDRNIFNEKNKKEVEIIKRKYDINKKYILYVGTLEERKNVVGLVKAFKGISDDYLLVLVGKTGWRGENIFNAIKNLELEKDVKIIGYANLEDLPLIYSGAELFIYPSFYEGFGIPPLESLACGTQVIVSDIPVFREILRDAAIYIDPENPDDIREKILYYLKNEEEKDKLKNIGFELLQEYKWEKSANQLLNIYYDVLK